MSKFAILIASLFLATGAAATEIPLANADFEQPMVGDRIPGWSRTQHAGVRAYDISRDADSFAHEKHSIRMERTTEQTYGLIRQSVQATELAGKPVELTATVKTAEVGKKGWVMLMTFKHHANIIDQVRATPVTGNTAWTEVVLRKIVPPNTTAIEVGFMLLDGGTGWADHVRLSALDSAKPEAD